MRKKPLAIALTVGLVAGLMVGGGMADAKKKKPKKPKACKKYDGGVDGKGLPVVVITDKATVKKPATAELAIPMGFGTSSNEDNEGGQAPSWQAYNVQVDSKSKITGLYALLEGPMFRDLDLYISGPDGKGIAWSAGFQAAPVTEFTDGTANGGKTTSTSEQVDGLKSADCTGYTLEIWGAGNEDVTGTLKLYLGKVVYDPAAQG